MGDWFVTVSVQSAATPQVSEEVAVADTVLTERRGKVLLITINRPEARNALDLRTATEVAAALDELDRDPAVSVGILTGAGGSFSAGMDLKAYLRGERPEVPGRGLAGLTRTPPAKPLVAAVEGYALAGGFELVLACDLVVASETARFGFPEVQRGLLAGSGGLIRLAGRLPSALAMDLALTGRQMEPAEARERGLVNEVVPEGQALDAAVALAGQVAQGSPMALRAAKEIVAGAPGWTWEQSWRRQDELLADVLASEDSREGAAAFAERRDPVWRGR